MGKITEININTKYIEDETIKRNKLFNVFVFGLPRSGTSMMMHILELLGVNMVHTSEQHKEKIDERFKKKYGEYHANPNGFFEITENLFYNYIKVFSKPYSGCKMIIPVNGIRLEVVKLSQSKIIFMTRDPEEIRQSQMAYYSPNADVSYIRTALSTQRVFLKNNNFDFLEINYNEILKDKVNIINKIKTFINSDVDIQEAVDFIQPSHNRFKRELLISGI
jgi:hypothetical protein